MEGSRISSHLLFFLLIGQASHTISTQPQTTVDIDPPDLNSTTPEENTGTIPPDPSPEPETSSSPTEATTGCLIEPQMLFTVVACAGVLVLVLCLLVSTVVLACQVCRLRSQASSPRPAHSNVDLVSGTGHWGIEHNEGGIVGPCYDSVMLEEVGVDEEQEEEEWEEREEEQAREGIKSQMGESGTTGEMAMQMQCSSSRDSCLEVPQDLENMPLMV